MNIDIEYIRKNRDRVNWDIISKYKYLSEAFIEEFYYKLNWILVSMYQKLSEEIIIKMDNIVNICWINISGNQKLSEKFIEKNINKITNWNSISGCQKLSEEFMWKYRKNIYWENILMRQNLTDRFLIKTYEYNKYLSISLKNSNIKYTLFQSQLGMSLLIL